MLSCCNSVALPLHFMMHTMSSATQCDVIAPPLDGCAKRRGSQAAKEEGLSMLARCSAAPAVAATVLSAAAADVSRTWGWR